MKYKNKLEQCDSECKVALSGLALTIIVWLICGFGLSAVDVEIFSTPIWIVAGLGGTFIFACLFSIIFAKFFMKDIALEEVIEEVEEKPASQK